MLTILNPVGLNYNQLRQLYEQPYTPHWRYQDCHKCGKVFIKIRGKCPYCELDELKEILKIKENKS